MHKIVKIIFCLSVCSTVGAVEQHASKSYHSSLSSLQLETLTPQAKLFKLGHSDSSNADDVAALDAISTPEQGITPAKVMTFLKQNMVPIGVGLVLCVGTWVFLSNNTSNKSKPQPKQQNQQNIAADPLKPGAASVGGSQPDDSPAADATVDALKPGAASVDAPKKDAASVDALKKDAAVDPLKT